MHWLKLPHSSIALFTGNANVVRDVYVGGRRVIAERRHSGEDAIAAGYRAAVAALG